ncbi:MAG: hypothetical protein M3R25_06350 [Bacteroidota bacterium]|nr:hypothetical protein [Bacteroidota bacterium]
MTTKQLIVAINQVLEQVPESALRNVLDYLNSVKGKSEQEINRATHLKRVLEEDRELLEQLAR